MTNSLTGRHAKIYDKVGGILAALLVLLSQFSLNLFFPFALLAFSILVRFYRPTFETLISGLLFIFITGLYLTGLASLNFVAFNILITIFLYSLVSAFWPSTFFFRGFALVFFFIGCVDIAINALSYFSGGDIFGRPQDFRPDDLLPRFGGLFGHAFISVSLTTAAFFASLFLEKKGFSLFFLMMLFFTGSLRGPTIGIFLIALYCLCYISTSKKWLLSTVLSMIAIIIAVVFLIDVTSNGLRSFAWLMWVDLISENLFFGYSGFENVEFDVNSGISASYLRQVGNFESTALTVIAHYGIFVFLLHIVAIIGMINVTQHYQGQSGNITPLIFAYYLLFDFFLFNFTSFVPTILFAFLTMSLIKKHLKFRSRGAIELVT